MAKSIRFTSVFPEEVMKDLIRFSEEEERSVAWVIRKAVQEYIDYRKSMEEDDYYFEDEEEEDF